MQGIPSALVIGQTVIGATAGSIFYAGTAGVLAQDNTKLKWGTTAGQGLTLGAGTATTAVSPLAITQTINNGGVVFPGFTLTYTATNYAAGSKAFSILGGAAGTTQVFTVLQNGNSGFGTPGPVAKLHISDGNVPDASLYTSDYEIISAQGTAPGLNIICASDTANHRGVSKATRSRGTLASPNPVTLNDQTFSLLGAAFDGTVQRATAGITFLIDGTVTNNVQAPQAITFETGLASRAEVMRISSGGNVGVRQSVPTAAVHLPAGTATANTAPLKIPSGTVLTTPEAGAIDADNNHIYWTNSGGTRLQLDQAGANFGPAAVASITVVNGIVTAIS